MSTLISEERHRVKNLTEDQGRELFDRHARELLGISGEEFIKRWDAGEFNNDPEQPEIVRLAMLLPLAR